MVRAWWSIFGYNFNTWSKKSSDFIKKRYVRNSNCCHLGSIDDINPQPWVMMIINVHLLTSIQIVRIDQFRYGILHLCIFDQPWLILCDLYLSSPSATNIIRSPNVRSCDLTFFLMVFKSLPIVSNRDPIMWSVCQISVTIGKRTL